jgi:hypothetical protein
VGSAGETAKSRYSGLLSDGWTDGKSNPASKSSLGQIRMRAERRERVRRFWLSKKEHPVHKLALALVSTVGLTVLASAAMADAAAPAPAPAAQPTNTLSDPDKMVCRSLAPATGTRIGARRVCRTQREWDDIRVQSQKETDKMQNTGFNKPGG